MPHIDGFRARIGFNLNSARVYVDCSKEIAEYFEDHPDVFKKILVSAVKRRIQKVEAERKELISPWKEYGLKVAKFIESMFQSDEFKKILKDLPSDKRRLIKRKVGLMLKSDLLDLDYIDYQINSLTTSLHNLKTIRDVYKDTDPHVILNELISALSEE